MSRIARSEIAAKISHLSGWSVATGDREAIVKNLVFGDFKQAWKFMNVVAEEADRVDHHPEWFNVYNKVNILLATHTCNGVSEKDIALAEFINRAEESVRS
ncbi:mitochondrial pterin-4-alpha-carbinolamine dehydratase [Andalucia godoyi]|uniref:4a-hydroxytetrahydrobiopterin dehydratase n=1 Tax=Andalucia godoyi TaxID=505711 RepID=A0A8K0AIE9_ANDGO|nr:mitochondrial pterin-4-alpha-carbinolamine dehydratase [Andalucia godoyi]|eukprot:ANDGO_04044.mRNA.1 mitochondrial pterin-4-alpha-carbinolamine dehydratase